MRCAVARAWAPRVSARLSFGLRFLHTPPPLPPLPPPPRRGLVLPTLAGVGESSADMAYFILPLAIICGLIATFVPNEPPGKVWERLTGAAAAAEPPPAAAAPPTGGTPAAAALLLLRGCASLPRRASRGGQLIRALSRASWAPLRPSAGTTALRRLSSLAPPPAAATAAAASAAAPQHSAKESLAAWAALWRSGGDSFTLSDVNENLVEWLPELLPGLPPEEAGGMFASLFGARRQAAGGAAAPSPSSAAARTRVILVPLCGRTPDLAWLADVGERPLPGVGGPSLHVIGLDAIAEPLRRFSVEMGNGLVPLSEVDPAASDAGALPALAAYRTARYSNLTLLHADLLDERVGPALLGAAVDAVWDRGGLTAMPPAERGAYARRLHALSAPGARLLLELLACNLPLDGACSVADAQRALQLAGFVRIRVLSTRDAREDYPQFRPQGLEQLEEVVMLAERD